MKKIKTFAFLAITLSSFAFMSFKPSNNNAAHSIIYANLVKVFWVKESHDFGDIPQGKPVSIEFVFTNNGDEPLLVADVVTSCGCTASDYTKEPIAPGKSSKIKVTYNAVAEGVFNKTITVNFNHVASTKILNIKGMVK